MKLVIWMQSSRKYSGTTPEVVINLQQASHPAPPLTGTLNGEGASEHLDDGTVEEVLGEHGRVNGRRHEDNSDLRIGLDHVPEDHQQEVRLRKREMS